MPGQSAQEFHRSMGPHGLQLPVVFITGHGDIAMGVNAIKDGAIEFLTKPFRDQELLDAIHKGIEIDRQRRRDGEALDALQQRWNTLNAGEREVVDGVVRGRLNKQIAGDLAVSEITVKVRRAQVMRKMGARTLVDLVRIADRQRRTAFRLRYFRVASTTTSTTLTLSTTATLASSPLCSARK
ncbi:hypothetical protein G6F40_014297 [Rhizopus arrhizus]|nr:hypothetical protein G6F40_014297 [Rhizopus arrhizus]